MTFDILCSNCKEICVEGVQTSPWIEYSSNGMLFDVNNTTGYYQGEEVLERPTENSYPLSNVLLQTVGHHHGSLHSMSDDLCMLFDIPRISKGVKSKTNDLIASMQDGLGRESVDSMQNLVKSRLKTHADDDYRIGIDEAWAARARYQ